MLIDYPLLGNATRASWLTSMTNIFTTPSAIFAGAEPFSYIGSAVAPSAETPWWFIMDFQEALSLKIWYWHTYSTDIPPQSAKIYGSDTGVFGGEETLIQTLDAGYPAGSTSHIPYTIDTPQSFRYYKFEILLFSTGWKPTYFYGLSFEFAPGSFAFDTVAGYIEPKNKIVGDDDWTFVRRSMFFGSLEDRFWSIACMFIEDFGWEIEVVSFPTQMLAKSRGVDDAQPYVYVFLTLDATSISAVKVYGYWDSDTKTGTLELPHTNNYAYKYEKCTFNTTEAGMGLCAWGNKDLIMMSSWENKTSSYKEGGLIIGRIPGDAIFRPAHTTLAVLSAAGTGITLQVISSAGFEEGGYYCLWGVNGEGRDFGVRVTEVTDATHIVVDNLPREYSAGSFIGTYPQTAFYYSYYIYNFGQRIKSGLIAEFGTFDQSDTAYNYIDPSGALGKHILFPLIWREVDGVDPGILAIDKHFSGRMSSQAFFDIHLVGAGKPGTATVGGVKTLEDTSKSWTVNEHVGKFVYISAGTGSHGCGNFVEIVSNTADTLTVAYDWIVTPAADCTYYIADEIWQVPVDIVIYGGALKCGG